MMGALAAAGAGKAAAGSPDIRAVPYGAAVRDSALADDPQYRAALIAYCSEVVGEGGLNWIDVRPTRDQFVFDQPDRLLAFAEANGMSVRGHPLVWYGALPDWLNTISSASEAQSVLVKHIETVVGRYRGKFKSWVVVNEPISDDPRSGGVLRSSVWQRWLGEDYIAIALRTAAAVDPEARLIVNEYDVEQMTGRDARRRNTLLALVRRLKDADLPLHVVGLQGHLHAEVPIDEAGLSGFLDGVRALDLEVAISELDVIDNKLPAPVAQRDAAAAALVKRFLATVFGVVTPTSLVTWGITDKYTWVPIWYSRRDGRPNRPLPLDAAYARKPMMDVIQRFAGRV
jgi:endo-1,4-beta-xylanase